MVRNVNLVGQITLEHMVNISITTAKIGLSGLREAGGEVLWVRKEGGSGRNCGKR